MTKQITVWPDDTEGRDSRKWIVSLDMVDEIGGGADGGSKTLDTHDGDGRDEAVAQALREGKERGLPVVAEDEHGQAEVMRE